MNLLTRIIFWSLGRQVATVPPDTGGGTGALDFSKASNSVWIAAI